MILKNITNRTLLMITALVGITTFFLWQIAPATAVEVAETNTLSKEIQFCPFADTAWAGFASSGKNIDLVEDKLIGEVKLLNNSPYVFGGVRLAVAVYLEAEDKVPAYWTILPEENILPADSNTSVSLFVDMSILPVGEYTVKVFGAQGDESAVLGNILQKSAQTEGITVTKLTNDTDKVSVSVKVNEQVFAGQAISLVKGEDFKIEIETKNGNKVPLGDSTMVGVVTAADVPLGTAVKYSINDTVRLMPKGSRKTELKDLYLNGGDHTIYAGLLMTDSLGPVVAVPLKITGTEGDTAWSYLSQVGLSDYPLKPETEVTVCVKNLGDNADLDLIFDSVTVGYDITDAVSSLASAQISSKEIGLRNFFTIKPNLNLTEFVLTVDFFKNGFVPAGEAGKDNSENILALSSLTQSFKCPVAGGCQEVVTTPLNNINNHQAPPYGFWHYFGIVLVALLMMWFMLGRLGSKKTTPVSEVTVDELN